MVFIICSFSVKIFRDIFSSIESTFFSFLKFALLGCVVLSFYDIAGFNLPIFC